MSGRVRSLPTRGHGKRASYLIGGTPGLGIETFDGDSATEALGALVRVLSGHDVAGARGAASAARARFTHGSPAKNAKCWRCF